MPQGNPARSRLDAMAKQKGFPSYAAMKAWEEKYRSQRTTTTPSPTKKKKNFFQSMVESLPHQGTLINKVTGRIRQARKDAKNVRPD